MKNSYQGMAIYVLFVAAGILQIACECVPGLDTPKIIDPSVAASVAFVHSLPDIGSLYPKSNYNSYGELNYASNFLKYNKISIYDIITLENNQNILYRQVVELKQNAFYTIVFYGAGNRIREILLEDSIQNYEGNYAYIRFIHTGINTGAIAFKLNDSLITNIMTYGSYTEFKPITPIKYSIEAFSIVNDSLIASTNDFTFLSDRKYLIILKGYSSGNPSRPLECKVLQYSH